jgi:energy-coupling factor transport system permease protein
MKNRDAFSGYHPLINILYFVQVIAYSMLFLHPVCLCISFLCAFTYAVELNGRRALRFALVFMLPMLLIAALLNPAFTHRGVTILAYLPSGNPLTLESIVYGIAAALMLITVISWFSCYNAVMTSDKFVYLFGRIIPALSLILSMALRLVPRFKSQIIVISNAQRCIGRDVSNGGVLRRARHGIKILSIMVTWALENAIETADSMRSRGYGLPGRTAFSIFKFDRRDRGALIFLLLCGAYIITGAALGGLRFIYYPIISGSWTPYSISIFTVLAALCAMPLLVNKLADLKWRQIKTGTIIPAAVLVIAIFGSSCAHAPDTPAGDAPSDAAAVISIECATILDNKSKLKKGKADVLPTDGVILPRTEVTFTEGESAFDVLKRVTREEKIHFEFSFSPIYDSAYIEGIGNIYEFDCGELSGWMYRVNGRFPGYGCSRYVMEAGDEVEWVFTCNLGRDIGGGYATEG